MIRYTCRSGCKGSMRDLPGGMLTLKDMSCPHCGQDVEEMLDED